MKQLLTDINLYPGSGFTGPGALGNPAGQEATLFDKVISTTIGLLTSIAFIYFTINFLLGAISWITSSGDAKAAEAAKTKLTSNLIGLVITIAAIFLTDFIGDILGIDILNPTTALGL